MHIRDIVRSVFMYDSAFIVGVLSASLVLASSAFAEDAYVESLKANTIFTDYYANQNTRIELDFEWLAGDYGDASVAHGGMVIGPWGDGCGTATAFWNAGGDNGMQFIVGSNRKFVNSGRTIAAARWFISMDGHTGKLLIARHGNATTNEVASGATFAANANWPVSLLGASTSTDGSAVDTGQFAKARIYGCKIYEWNETSRDYDLVRDYVPVLRDGEPCLRDTVTDTFAVDPRAGAKALGYGGDIKEVGHGCIQSVAAVGLNTGYKMKATSRVELDCALTSSGTQRPMGCWNNASALRDLVWVDGTTLKFCVNSGSPKTTGLTIDNKRHTYVIDQAAAKGYYMTGATIRKEVGDTTASAGAVASNPLSIFADSSNSSGTTWSQPAMGMKCYGLKIYESGILVTNFVPYVRNGEIGFRDTLTGAFLSAGTRNFVAGGNIALSGPTARDAFVESDGTQVLNSGYKVGYQSRVEVDLAFTGGNRGFLFGNFASGSVLRWCAWLDSGPLRFSGGSSGNNTYIMSPGPGSERIKAIYDAKNAKGWVVRNGVQEEKKDITSAGNLTCAYPMGIFGSLKSEDGTVVDTTVANGVMRVYSVRIYEDDATEPAAEFLPYKGSEGVGLYDTKTGKLALKHSSSVADPTIGGMGVDGEEKWLVDPTDETVSSSKSVVLTGKAVGAVSYKWTLNGEAIEGGTDGSLEVSWRKHTKTPDVYSVTPVYDVFGSEVDGEPKTCQVTNEPLGMVVILR